MNSRLLYPILAALPLILASPSKAAERRYAISDFDRIRVFGPFSVIVQAGRATSVSASGDVAALDVVSVTSSGGVLTVQTLAKARASWTQEPYKPARLVIVLPQLKGLRLLGSGSIAAAEMRGIATDIVLTGSGQISVAKLTSDNATANLSGSGRIVLAGSAKNFSVTIDGSGELDAAQLSASDVKIVSTTSGRVIAKGLRTADVKQRGAGEVNVAGKASCLVENTGAGVVRCGD